MPGAELTIRVFVAGEPIAGMPLRCRIARPATALRDGAVRTAGVSFAECGSIYDVAVGPRGDMAAVINGKEEVVVLRADGRTVVWRAKVQAHSALW